MTIREMCQGAGAIAELKGFNDRPKEIGTLLALVHSEISEALEEARGGHRLDEIYINPNDGKPEGFIIELADAVIRIGHIADALKLDLETAIETKMIFNESRPKMHGKKF